MNDLRTRLIQNLINMRYGTKDTTPQPDCAREAFKFYNDLLPSFELGKGVKEALK